MIGCIDLEYPFSKSWIWETDSDTIWVSMVTVIPEERNKGHCSKLIDDLILKYKKIIVPTPSDIMIHILEKRGFEFRMGYEDKHGQFFVLEKKLRNEE